MKLEQHRGLQLSRFLWVSLILSVISVILLPLVGVETHVTLLYTPDKIVGIVEGTSLEAPGTPQTYTSLEILTGTSPNPVRPRSLQIFDDTDRLLFSTDFSDHAIQRAHNVSGVGDWWIDTSEIRSLFKTPITLTNRFRIEATFMGRSSVGTKIQLRGDGALSLEFRRGYINRDAFIKVGDVVVAATGITPPIGSSISGVADIFIPSLLGALLLSAACILGSYRTSQNIGHETKITGKLVTVVTTLQAPLFVCCIVVGGLCSFVWMAGWVHQGLPHFQDDLCYLLRAKWLSSGHFFEYRPPFDAAISFPYTYFSGSKWVAVYPIGWSLLLVLGELIGHPWIISPLCGGVSLIVIWLLAKEMFDEQTAAFAVLLFAVSPMANIMSGSMLSHAAMLMCLLLCIYLLVSALNRGQMVRFIGAGMAAGYALGIRPLTAAAVGIVLASFVILDILLNGHRFSRRWGGYIGSAFGLIVGLSPALLDNYMVTGSPFLFAYSQGAGVVITFESIRAGLAIAESTWGMIPTMAFPWGWGWQSGWIVRLFTYSLAVVPFVTGTWNRYSVLLACIFFSIPVAYTGYAADGAHGFGPRYYYEAFFALFLLSAQGISSLSTMRVTRHDSTTYIARPTHVNNSDSIRWGPPLLLISLLVAGAWSLPQRLNHYRGYNNIDDSLARAIHSQGISRGIIFVDSWYDVASGAELLPRTFGDASLIIVLKSNDDAEVRATYPTLPTYYWSSHKLQKITETETAS